MKQKVEFRTYTYLPDVAIVQFRMSSEVPFVPQVGMSYLFPGEHGGDILDFECVDAMWDVAYGVWQMELDPWQVFSLDEMRDFVDTMKKAGFEAADEEVKKMLALAVAAT